MGLTFGETNCSGLQSCPMKYPAIRRQIQIIARFTNLDKSAKNRPILGSSSKCTQPNETGFSLNDSPNLVLDAHGFGSRNDRHWRAGDSNVTFRRFGFSAITFSRVELERRDFEIKCVSLDGGPYEHQFA